MNPKRKPLIYRGKSDESSKEKDSNNVQPRKRTRKRIMVDQRQKPNLKRKKKRRKRKRVKMSFLLRIILKTMIKKINQKIIIKVSKITETNRRNPMTIMTLLELFLLRCFRSDSGWIWFPEIIRL